MAKRLEPGPAPELDMGSSTQLELENGLNIIVVENHRTPSVYWNLTLEFPPFLEGDKAGLQAVASDMMSAGTDARSKAEIAEEVEFLRHLLCLRQGILRPVFDQTHRRLATHRVRRCAQPHLSPRGIGQGEDPVPLRTLEHRHRSGEHFEQPRERHQLRQHAPLRRNHHRGDD